jgi:hypothetical protein
VIDATAWVALALCFVALLGYRLADRWLKAREAIDGIATKAEVAACRDRLGVHDKAIANLAEEFHEEVAKLRAQQIGVLSGMSAGTPRRTFNR